MPPISPALSDEAIELLKKLIKIESFSKEENYTADAIAQFLVSKNIEIQRLKNNVWAKNRFFDDKKPTILLNSHHDTVRPNASWTLDPFEAKEFQGKLFGLGSNDAGGALVSLMMAFCYFYERPDLTHNLILAATAEEEISGRAGIELLKTQLPPLSFAIVGEPTEMHLAIAEKGLLVIDCTAHGKAGHAARNEGDNAIYKALRDIAWVQSYQFAKVSELLGPVKMSVTVINAGTQHNVVPDRCSFTIDVRVNDCYELEEVIEIITQNLDSELQPRSVRLRSSAIAATHPIVQAGLSVGKNTYGSPTMSDQALLDCPSLKMGPGHSERSHTANEFIFLHEIEEGITQYITMLEAVIGQ
jgi:acetylornithine deacetylase